MHLLTELLLILAHIKAVEIHGVTVHQKIDLFAALTIIAIQRIVKLQELLVVH
jgi:hypothetical protein